MLRIDITPLKPGIHHFELEPEAGAVELEADRFRDLHVEVRLDVHERRILAVLNARATARLVCDRTLRPFDQQLEGRFEVLFAPPEFVQAEEDAYDEVRVLQAGDQTIDLTSVVRDTLLLAIPQRCIAPGAEEEEIETVFGEPDEENIDPRWEALRRLRSREDE